MYRVLPFFSRRLALLCVIAAFALHGLHVWRIPYLDRLDAWIYDARLLANAPRTLDPNVVIVDIDEPSLAAFGRWPWARDTMAALVRRLTADQQAAAVGFDVVFAEAESPATDQTLAHALQGQPVVLGYYFTSDRAEHTSGTLPAPVLAKGVQDFQVTSWTGFGANLAELVEAAPQSGFFNAMSDPDGVIRSAPLLAEYHGQYYESLGLALYRRYLASQGRAGELPTVAPHFATNDPRYHHLDAVRLDSAQGTKDIPVDDTVVRLIPYRGEGGANGASFRYVSAANVLLGKLPTASLKGKVILIGSSAPALEDLRVTPMGGAYPGVEVQANIVAGLIDGRAPSRPDYALGFEIFQLAVLGALMLAFLPALSALSAVALALVLSGGIWFLHRYLFMAHGLVLPLAASFLLIACCFVVRVIEGFFVEGKRRRHLMRLFGSYVSPKWVSRMVRSDADYSMQASNQVLTVMFCDMRGFTKLASTMPPLALQALLNEIFNRLSPIIQAHGGTIDKYMGDCIMAFWGAPEIQLDHAARAVRCAIALQTAIEAYNMERHRYIARTSDTLVHMGIGINTGLMCVGDMGSDIRRSYTVVGAAVNLASRLEGLCKTYNQALIVSAATKDAAAQNGFSGNWLDLGSTTVAGSDDLISIFTLAQPPLSI
jgi:adenylate cyclase